MCVICTLGEGSGCGECTLLPALVPYSLSRTLALALLPALGLNAPPQPSFEFARLYLAMVDTTLAEATSFLARDITDKIVAIRLAFRIIRPNADKSNLAPGDRIMRNFVPDNEKAKNVCDILGDLTRHDVSRV